jgi:hypothetical protein
MAATILGNRAGRTAIITANEANQLVTGTGILRRVIVNNVGTSATLDIYDHDSTTTNKVFEWVSADGKVVREVDLPFNLGLHVVTGGTMGNVVLVYE